VLDSSVTVSGVLAGIISFRRLGEVPSGEAVELQELFVSPANDSYRGASGNAVSHDPPDSTNQLLVRGR